MIEEWISKSYSGNVRNAGKNAEGTQLQEQNPKLYFEKAYKHRHIMSRCHMCMY